MDVMIGGGRPLRACALCGQVDDHPRHVLGRTVAARLPRPPEAVVARVVDAVAGIPDAPRILRELLGERGAYRHLDCCREAGCPDGSCNAAPRARGGQLLSELMAGRER